METYLLIEVLDVPMLNLPGRYEGLPCTYVVPDLEHFTPADWQRVERYYQNIDLGKNAKRNWMATIAPVTASAVYGENSDFFWRAANTATPPAKSSTTSFLNSARKRHRTPK